MITKSNVSEIWQYGRGFYKAYTENLDVGKQIMKWSSVENSSIYYTHTMQIFAYDFIFPTRTYNRVAKALELPKRKKLIGRIKQGEKLKRFQIHNRIAQVKSSKLTPVED